MYLPYKISAKIVLKIIHSKWDTKNAPNDPYILLSLMRQSPNNDNLVLKFKKKLNTCWSDTYQNALLTQYMSKNCLLPPMRYLYLGDRLVRAWTIPSITGARVGQLVPDICVALAYWVSV